MTGPDENRKSEILAKIILAFASPLILMILIEGFAYLWEASQGDSIYAWELVASRRIELIEHYGAAGGYTLMAPHASYEWQQIPVDINSRGLRGPEWGLQKPPNTHRVLNLGDSIAMGWGVPFEDTYGHRLEQLLNEGDPSPRNYQVINAGVPGWNPENYHAFLAAEGWQYEPDMILLGLTVVNDIYGPNAMDLSDSPAFIEWMRANTYTWPFLSIQSQWIRARLQGRERIGVISPPTKASSYFPLDPDHARWDAIWKEIRAIERQANERGVEFLLVIFPMEFQVVDSRFEILAQELLIERAAASGISVLDLLGIFREACLSKAGGSCTLEDRYLFADVWMHPSPLGHRLAAKAIFNRLTIENAALNAGLD